MDKSNKNKTEQFKVESQSKVESSKTNDQPGLLEELFLEELKDIYWAEKHLVKALPKMEKAATSEELKQAFADHLEVTKEQVARLEQAFEIMGKKALGKKCEAMDGLTKESEGIIEDTDKGTLTRDIGLIMAAQKIEHYEISTYGSLAQLAKTIGYYEVSDLMNQTLREEQGANQLLTRISESNITEESEESDFPNSISKSRWDFKKDLGDLIKKVENEPDKKIETSTMSSRIFEICNDFQITHNIQISKNVKTIISNILLAVIEDPHPKWISPDSKLLKTPENIVSVYLLALPLLLKRIVDDEKLVNQITLFDFLHWLSDNINFLCIIDKK